jgi:hypothetical protein
MVGWVDIIGEFIFLLNNRYTSSIIQQRFDYFHQSGKRYKCTINFIRMERN